MELDAGHQQGVEEWKQDVDKNSNVTNLSILIADGPPPDSPGFPACR